MKPRHFWYLFEAEKKTQDEAQRGGKPEPGHLTKQERRELRRLIDEG